MGVNNKVRIEKLVSKLEDNSISEKELKEFMALVQDPSYDGYLDKIMKQRMSTFLNAEKKVRRFNFKRWSMVAASIVLLGLTLYYFQSSPPDQIIYQTAHGETKKVVLPDHSEITLNANSKLIWLEDETSNSRDVMLEGEAYCEVFHDESRPFHIRLSDVTITVLGTTFNVNSRGNESQVYLKSGSVNVQNNHQSNNRVLLVEGESAYFDVENREVVKTTDQRYINQAKWVEGLLVFKNVPFKEILQSLEDIYGFTIRLEDSSLAMRPMDFALPYSDWEITSAALELAMGGRIERDDKGYELKLD
ncbi:FecR family protein [Membranihabitans marinus]|uniref:FecR family protein n=1 Tax=Membranihabitans marinus TaxID=1227546 RepID=UPI001F19A354|nr:FecR domain-containing protein [Membranihabitans marinus]